MASALATVVVVATAFALVWSTLDGIARWLMIRQLQALTGRPATIERVDVHLWQGRLAVAGLRLGDLASGQPLAELERLEIRLEVPALLRGHVWIREATAGGVRVRIVRSEGGAFNIADLLRRDGGQAGSWAVTVDRFALDDGAVSLEDRSRVPVHTWRADNIAMEVSGLSTNSTDSRGTGRLTATVAGAPVTADIADVRLVPLHLRGRLVVKDMDATLAGISLPPGVAAVLDRARLSTNVAATVDAREGVQVDADGRLDDLTLRSHQTGDPLVAVPSLTFTVAGAGIDASGGQPRLGRIEVAGEATLFDIRGGSAGRLDISRLRLLVEGQESPGPASARLALTADLGKGGSLDVQGPLRLAPLGAELRARVTRLDPAVVVSYAALPIGLAGLVDTDFTVDVSTSTAEALAARVRGRVTVNRAAVAGGQQVIIARQVELDGVDAEWPRIGIARIRVAQPVAVVERDRTGRLLLAALTTSPRAASESSVAPARDSAAAAPAITNPGPTVEIGEIALDDGTLTVDDASATPPARLTLSGVRASARKVAWPARSAAPITLKATTPGAGTLEASGTMSLDPVRVDVRARLAGAALAPYQGYLPFPARIEGRVNADVAIAGALAPRADLSAKGTASVADLALGDGTRRVVRVARIETLGLEYTWPSTLAVDRLHVKDSSLRLVRQADGSFPLRALFTLARQPPGEAGTTGSSVRGEAPAIVSATVRHAILEGGRVRLVDESVNPPARVDLSEARLAAQGFSWPARDPVPIDMQVSTPNGGRVSARGSLDLAGAGAELKVAVNGVDLSPAQPYLSRAGRVAAKASADLDVAVRLRPLSLTARGTAALADVAIAESTAPLVTAARVETAGLDYAWPAKVAIDRLRVQAPRATVERRRDGTLPLVDLLAGARSATGSAVRSEPPASPGPTAFPLEISIREGAIDDAMVSVTDATVNPPARIELAGMRLVARDVTWPSRGPTPVELRVPMPGGGLITAGGQIARGLAGLDLDLTLAGVDVASVRSYLPVRGRLAGKASARLALTATFQPLAIGARGSASLADLAVVDGERRLLTAEHAEATGLDYAWPAAVSIDRLRVRKPWALIDRVSGQLPVLDALATAGPAAGSSTPGEPARASTPGFQVSIRRSVIEDGAAAIVDAAASSTASLDITGARLTVRDLTWPARGPAGISLRAATPGPGTLDVRGQLHLDRSTIDAKVVLEGVDVAALQPFMPGQAKLGGRANANLHLKGALVPLNLTASGTMSVADGSLGDGHRSLVTVKRLDLTGLTAEWPRGRAIVERVTIREPWALVERDPRGGFPLLALIAPAERNGRKPAAPAAASRTPAAATRKPAAANSRRDAAPHIELGTLAIEEGFVRFTDQTTRPVFVEEASRLTVTARDLSTEPAARSEVAIAARLTGGAQIELHGQMGPLDGPLFADVRGQLSGLALNRVNPYVNSLLGWVAREGSVSGTTQFRIRDDKLQADNEIVIGQPRFVPSRRGDEVRERVGVPLDLLVSLLKNTRGEVRLSVPVSGSLSTREFDFGDAVWEALRKAVINVLALPVSWVGKIFYTGDARIDTITIWPVYFDPGTTRMKRGFDAHAERLAEFMRQTPAIAYALKPVMTVDDVTALRRDAVRQRIDALAREAGQADPATIAARLFAERFPGRPVPPDLNATVDELARDEPVPDQDLRALAAGRLALILSQLEAKGVDRARLRTAEGAVPVESSGAGRVEFEMIPDAAAAASQPAHSG
jgi:hypothetical protein